MVAKTVGTGFPIAVTISVAAPIACFYEEA